MKRHGRESDIAGYVPITEEFVKDAQPYTPIRNLINEVEKNFKQRNQRVFFQQQLSGELLYFAKDKRVIMDEIAVKALEQWFNERGYPEGELKRHRVTIRYEVEPY